MLVLGPSSAAPAPAANHLTSPSICELLVTSLIPAPSSRSLISERLPLLDIRKNMMVWCFSSILLVFLVFVPLFVYQHGLQSGLSSVSWWNMS